MKTEKEKITAADVVNALRERFPLPAYCLLEQVADGTGARQNRWADAVAMSVWPSRGYVVHGIEIKVNRYDWLHEIRQPKKSEAVQRYCDYWWIAVSEGVVQPGELPETWGLLVLNGKKLRCEVNAPKLTPKALDVDFVASVLRNMARTSVLEINEAARKAETKGFADGQKYEQEHGSREHKRLADRIEVFEQRSGIRLDSWDYGNIADAVKVVIGLNGKLHTIQRAAEDAGEIKIAMDKIVSLVEAAKLFHPDKSEPGVV